MAVAVSSVDNFYDAGTFYFAKVTLGFSGNYATNGDSTSGIWSNIKIKSSKVPIYMSVQGIAGFDYKYDVTNQKIIVRGQEPTNAGAGVLALTELSAGAYPAGITGDTVTAIVYFQKV